MILHIKTGVPKTTVPLCQKKKRETYLLYNNNNYFPNSTYLSKRNSGNTRRMREICSKLTVKTAERRHWRCSGLVIINFEQIISPIGLVFPWLTLNKC